MALHPEVLNELAVEIAATLQLVVRMSLLTQSGHSCLTWTIRLAPG
jgi:hypothetical protein